MKILLSAFSFAPNQGSESEVGWQIATGLAQQYEVWVLTTHSYKESTITHVKENPIANLHIIYFSIPFLTRLLTILPFGSVVRSLLINFYYLLWQMLIFPVASNLHKQEKFDLAHHITWQRYWMPSGIALLSIPFIWGPVGAAETIPRAFWRTLSWSSWWIELIRQIMRWQGELNPFLWHTARHSHIAIANTPESAARMKKLGAKKVQLLSAVAISNEFIELFDQNPIISKPFIFISMGRLISWKGHHLALQSLAQIQELDWEYWISGMGPEKDRLKQLAVNLGIDSKVHFLGYLAREKLYEALHQSNSLIHLGLRNDSMVVIEAMAAAKPVICLNIGGPSLQITNACGFRIEAISPQQCIHDAANAMRQLIEDNNLCLKMGAAARQRVKEEYNWKEHIKQISAVYSSVSKSN